MSISILMPESFQALPLLAPKAALGGAHIARGDLDQQAEVGGGSGMIANPDTVLSYFLGRGAGGVPGRGMSKEYSAWWTFIWGGGWWGEAGPLPLSFECQLGAQLTEQGLPAELSCSHTLTYSLGGGSGAGTLDCSFRP